MRVHDTMALGVVAAAVVATLAFARAPAADDIAEGRSLYRAKCGGCHSLDANRIGPAHRGVVGRRVASAPGYAYSTALKRLSGAWTPARLDRWLQDPQGLAPGSRMFLAVDDAMQRREIIAFLAANPLRPAR